MNEPRPLDLTLDADLAGPDCATELEFGALATGTLGAPRQLALEQHAATCPRCAAEFELAQAFAVTTADGADLDLITAQLATTVAPSARTTTTARSTTAAAATSAPLRFALPPRRDAAPPLGNWSSPLRLAASLALVVGAGLLVARLGSNQPGLPDPTSDSPVRNATVEVVEGKGALSVVPTRLVWAATPSAARYRLELATESGERLLELEVDQPSLDLNQSVRDRLATGVACRWSVAALDTNGAVLAQSAPVSLRVMPTP